VNAPLDQNYATAEVRMPTITLVAIGKNLLELAEKNRREAPSFEASPLPGELPDSDWAPAMNLISAATQHLDESLPTGQRDRTANAGAAMGLGLLLLQRALLARGLDARPVIQVNGPGVDAPAAAN
jgi:hypothetical protein